MRLAEPFEGLGGSGSPAHSSPVFGSDTESVTIKPSRFHPRLAGRDQAVAAELPSPSATGCLSTEI